MSRPRGLLVHQGPEPLSEASLSRVYHHWLDSGFAALTSWRHFDRETGEPIPVGVNKRKLAALQRSVRAAGFGHIPLESVWREEGGKTFDEPSILVPATRGLKERHAPDADSDIGLLRKLTLTLGKKYDQDSVLVVQAGGRGEVLSTRPATFGQVEVKFTKFIPSDMNWIFSKLRGQNRAFFLESAPGSFSEAQLRNARGEIPRGSRGPTVDERMSLKGNYKAYAKLVADAYDARPVRDSAAGASYAALIQHAKKMFKQIQSRVKVVFSGESADEYELGVSGGPYKDAADMTRRVRETGVLLVNTDFSENLVSGWTPRENWIFRAVHDYVIHIGGHHDFSLNGELATFNRHAKIAPKAALPALFSEVVGQVAYAIVRKKFPNPQKACILYGFDYVNIGIYDAEEYERNFTQESVVEATRT